MDFYTILLWVFIITALYYFYKLIRWCVRFIKKNGIVFFLIMAGLLYGAVKLVMYLFSNYEDEMSVALLVVGGLCLICSKDSSSKKSSDESSFVKRHLKRQEEVIEEVQSDGA